MVVRRFVAVGACLGLCSCLRFGAYFCDADTACRSRGEEGVCQPTRFCSYPDTSCESGYRYDEFAGGDLASTCAEASDGTSTTGGSSTQPPDSTTTSTSGSSEGTSSDSSGPSNPMCGDAVVDADEACDDGNDIDGDGCNSDCQQSGAVLWEVIHPELNSVARGVAVGPDGSIAVAGGRVENDQSDILVLKFASDGVARWQRVHASPDDGFDEGRQVVFDADGNVYATGYEFIGMPLQRRNAWTQVYDAEGAAGWNATYDSPTNADDRAFAIALHGDEVVVAGFADQNTFLRSYGLSDGAVRWTFADGLAPMDFDEVNAAVASDDGVFCAGEIRYGDDTSDGWFGRFTSDGLQWVEIVDEGGPEADAAFGIGLTPDGGIVVGGRRGGQAWVAQYSSDRELQWERYDDSLQTPSDVRGVAVDNVGQVVAVGYETDPMQGEDAFVTKYDVDGTLVWSNRYDGPAGGTDRARAVAIGSDRTIAVAGFTDEADGQRLWLRKYAP